MWPSESMRMLSGLMSLRDISVAVVKCKHVPMDEAQVVNGLDSKDTLGHVELGHVLGERIVLDQPEGVSEVNQSQSTHIVIKSPPGKNSITRYRKSGSWNE